MKNAFEMGSGAMIGSAIEKLIKRIHRHTDSMEVA
jgi:Uri superfamily endonuclease